MLSEIWPVWFGLVAAFVGYLALRSFTKPRLRTPTSPPISIEKAIDIVTDMGMRNAERIADAEHAEVTEALEGTDPRGELSDLINSRRRGS